MRKRSVYLIVAGLLIFICLGIFETFSLIPEADTFEKYVCTEKDKRYAVAGSKKDRRLYQLAESGKITRMSDKIKDEEFVSLTISEDGMRLFLLSGYEEKGNLYYRLREYNKELKMVRQTERQRIKGDVSGQMQADDDSIVLTALSDDRKTAAVYELDLSKKRASFEETETISAPQKRFYIRAEKREDIFYAQYDNGAVVSLKATGQKEETKFPSSVIEELDTPVKVRGALAVLRYNGMRVFVGTLLKGIAVIFLLFLFYGLAGKTSYRLRRFAAQELILLGSLFAVTGICVHFLNVQDGEICKECTENSVQSMTEQMKPYVQGVRLNPQYADTAAYRTTYSTMLKVKKSTNWRETPTSVRLVKLGTEDHKIVIGDKETAGSLFGREGEEQATLYEAKKKNKVICTVEKFQDEYRISCAAPAGDGIAQNSYWSLCIFEEKSEDTVAIIHRILLFSGLFAAVGTVCLFLLLYVEGKQMRQLVEVFKSSAQGRYKKERRPLHLNLEMETLWNGLDGYIKGMERIRYRQNSQQELYARFIPKALEVLFAEWTPKKLHAEEYVSDSGIIGCISLDEGRTNAGEQQMAVINKAVDILFRVQEKEPVVFVPQSGDLKKIWGIFSGNEEQAVQTGIRLLGDIGNMSILVHRSHYTYGIVGNGKQVLPYFSVETSNDLMYYAEKLHKLHIKAAITEEVAREFEHTISMRCIGYIVVSGDNRKLYEVLEAYTASRRYVMEAQTIKFAKALELYYGSDFYLARNIFVEVLRECPWDEVAKWYLFACEKRLENAKAAEAGYGLFMED